MRETVLSIQQIKLSADASIVGKDLDCRVSLVGQGSSGCTKAIRSEVSLYTWGRLTKAPLLELHAASLQRLRGAELIVEVRDSGSGVSRPIAVFRWPLQSLQSKPPLELITFDGHGLDPKDGRSMPGLAPPRCTVKVSWNRAAPTSEIPVEVLEELEERECDASSWFMRQHKFWSKDQRLVAAKVDFAAEKAALAKSRKASAPVADSRRGSKGSGAPRPQSTSRGQSRGRLPPRPGHQQPPSPTGSCRSLGSVRSVASSRGSGYSAGAASMPAALESQTFEFTSRPSCTSRPSSASNRPPPVPRLPQAPTDFVVTANTPLTSDSTNAISRDGRVLRDTTRGSRARRIKEEQQHTQTELMSGLSGLAGMLRQMAADANRGAECASNWQEDYGEPIAVM